MICLWRLGGILNCSLYDCHIRLAGHTPLGLKMKPHYVVKAAVLHSTMWFFQTSLFHNSSIYIWHGRSNLHTISIPCLYATPQLGVSGWFSALGSVQKTVVVASYMQGDDLPAAACAHTKLLI